MMMRQSTMSPGVRSMSFPKIPVQPASRIERWSWMKAFFTASSVSGCGLGGGRFGAP